MTGQREHRASVERLWAAFGAREFERAGDELHDDFVAEWPHSGERIRGRENFIAVNREHPDPWISVELLQVVADGDVVATEVRVPVEGAEPAYAASFFEFENGKIRRLTEYWVEGRSQEPYESRSDHTERM